MKTWIKVIIGLVFVGIIIGFLVYKFVYNKQHPDYENMEASVTLNAQDLYQAFKKNSVDASAKYNGK